MNMNTQETILSKYAQEKLFNINKIKTDMTGIAKLIGGTYKDDIEGCDWGGTITFPDGKSMFLRLYKDKYTVSISAPKDNFGRRSSFNSLGALTYNEATPEISFSAKKTPEAMANDILKRILPVYQTLWDKCQPVLNQHKAYQDKKDANIKRLALLGLDIRGDKDGQTLHFYDRKNGYGDLQVSDKTASIDLRNVSIDKMEQILKIIMKVSV